MDAGLQTTLQAGPRRGLRHLGVPTGGPADPLSLALANRIVGNPGEAGGLEVTLTGASFRVLIDTVIGVAGAPCPVGLDGRPSAMHEPVRVRAGQTITLGAARAGCRTYLAVAGGLSGTDVLGSVSTDLTARLGGVEGRGLRTGDAVTGAGGTTGAADATPPALRQPFGSAWALRAVPGPEADVLSTDGRDRLFGDGWRLDAASNRVGLRLKGGALPSGDVGAMQSVAALPGTVQLPASGLPIILGVEGGTTGGYPRVAQVIRADRHLIGQARPGAPLRLLLWRSEDADAVLAEKTALLRDWLGPGFSL